MDRDASSFSLPMRIIVVRFDEMGPDRFDPFRLNRRNRSPIDLGRFDLLLRDDPLGFDLEEVGSWMNVEPHAPDA